MDFIEVEILNWDKYNPRKDYKKPWWFACSNTITSDAMFSEFSDAEFKAWIHILCTASVQNKNSARVFFKHAERACGIKRTCLVATIRKLEILECIRTPDRICTDPVRDLIATEQNNTIQNNTNNIAHFQFAEFWSGYPRKIGKSKSEKAYQKAIDTGSTHEEIMGALEKYKAQLKREGTEKKYIKHPATWFSSWRDCLEPDYGQAEDYGSGADVTGQPGYRTISQMIADGDASA